MVRVKGVTQGGDISSDGLLPAEFTLDD